MKQSRIFKKNFLGFRMPGAGFEPAASRYPRNCQSTALIPYEPCALTS